jgi:hypothetical protein
MRQMRTRRPGRRATLFGLAATSVTGACLPLGRVQAAPGPFVEMWKDRACACCGAWARHMRESGFDVRVHEVADMERVKQANGVPDALQSCHTAVVGGYVIEGHVPADDVRRLLAERLRARGLSVPGMPPSAPGMDIPGHPFQVVLFGAPTGDEVYARH